MSINFYLMASLAEQEQASRPGGADLAKQMHITLPGRSDLAKLWGKVNLRFIDYLDAKAKNK